MNTYSWTRVGEGGKLRPTAQYLAIPKRELALDSGHGVVLYQNVAAFLTAAQHPRILS